MSDELRGLRSHEKFSLDDFHRRWQAARTSAVISVLGGSPGASLGGIEEDLVAQVSGDKARDLVLRGVFDNSRRLGISVVRFLGLSWEVSDIAEVLQKMRLSCLAGTWTRAPSARVLERPGCEQAKKLGSFYCDYWREATDGLVMGVGETERFARHASVGHGDASCVDVFFDDSLDADGRKPRHGAVPWKIEQGLSEIRDRLRRMRATLTLEGLSEGVLYYRLESEAGPLCGASGRSLHESIAKEVRARFPGLLIRDASPLAVYGEGTK